MSKNEKRKLARYGHQPIEKGWKAQKGLEALGEALVMYGKADIVGYVSLRLPAERRAELRANGVWVR